MDWKTDISSLAQTWMKFLGDFRPTVHEEKGELKGYMHDDDGVHKVYLDACELRELATACNEVADWLDNRAESVPNTKIELPALPAQVLLRVVMPDDYRYGNIYGYDPASLRAYGAACANAALEAAAKACEQKRGETNLGVDAWITCDAIARQLRALKEPT